MSRSTTRTRAARGLLSAALALGLTAGAALAAGAPASAAAGFIAAPNSMVGVATEIVINAPKAVGQTVSIGAQVGGFSTTIQTTIGTNGFGSVTWTPGAAGTWTFNGLGVIANLGSTTAQVATAPTYTVLLAQNQVQQGVPSTLLATVVSPLSSFNPTGTVVLNSGNVQVGSAPLAGGIGSTASTANISWTPGAPGPIDLQATFVPDNPGQAASTSPISSPNSNSTLQTVAVRWPANLYAGEQTLLQAVLGPNIPEGTVSWFWDNAGISGSIQTSNYVGSLQWAPPATGVHTIKTEYTGARVGGPSGLTWYNGNASQVVNVLPARPMDNITVDPPAQPAWNIAQPISMVAGKSLTLAGTSQSGTPVIFSEQGPCVISGATLTALSAGQCQVTAQSPGTAAIKPGSETYTITITKAPKKKR